MTPRTEIVFDTDCVLCSGMVHFVLRHERAPTIRFVSAWSPTGLQIAAQHGLSRSDLNDTFLVVTDGRGYLRSDAGLIILRHLRPPWSWLTLGRFVPRALRDRVYDVVARRRYRWFGHKPKCFLAPTDAAHRYIDC